MEHPIGPPIAAMSGADRRILLVLCAASILAVLNFAAPAPFFTRIADDLDTTVPLLGQLTTMMTVLSAVLGLAVGPLADRFGARRLLAGGMVAVGVNLIGVGIAPSYPVLLGLAAIGGLGDAALFGLPLAIAGTHFVGAAKTRAVAWTAASLPIGSSLGIPLLTLAGTVLGWRSAIAAVGAGAIGMIWWAIRWLPEGERRVGETGARSLFAPYGPLLRDGRMVRLYAIGALRAACWIGLFTYLAAFLTAEFGFGADGIGLAFVLAGGGAFLGNLATPRWFARVPQRPGVAVATGLQGLLIGALLILPLDAPVALGLLVLVAFSGGPAFVWIATLLGQETPVGAGTTMVLNGSVFNIGTAAGTAVGGLLISLGGYPALGVGLAGFALLGVLCLVVPTRR
ncbi:MAG: hypothetical protein AVDCRST_MAG73-3249 [uncultured Thermomicrobiales bacterium]|uniref:Major facilitator superfamily (MFS) profile domain-containing protein n=1 Tax=uncultured Thermomicrobiales bacterium TaxID=1645740 RepID=A0A6J4UQU8_9BACT|nr:MAG: hypothetical protein AVDCRST_MAG73-3249 [uncultured Thermomicrobiales bacterium]